MENIVAITFNDAKKGKGAVITWGRLFDVICDQKLLEIARQYLLRCGVHDLQSIELCYSLMEISDYPLFYEQLAFFIKQPILLGLAYKKWVKKKRRALQNGQEILFVGFKNMQQEKNNETIS